jgi:hypothetical protein
MEVTLKEDKWWYPNRTKGIVEKATTEMGHA